jgi:hypothetical protein
VRLALLLLAASALAAAPDPMKPLRPLIGRWSGRVNCGTGDYGLKLTLEDADGGLFARYEAASLGASPLSGKGDVGVVPRPKPGEFVATSNGVSVRIALAEKGRVLIFSPLPSSNPMAAAVKFAGTARLDKKRAKAVLRYTVKTPIGDDTCLGSMTRTPP